MMAKIRFVVAMILLALFVPANLVCYLLARIANVPYEYVVTFILLMDACEVKWAYEHVIGEPVTDEEAFEVVTDCFMDKVKKHLEKVESC